MILRIFVSSTWLDLQPERQAVETALQRIRETKFIGMEYFGSRDETTRKASLDEVDRSQVYVGLFGGRYGSGITEDEYRRARELDLPCFPYFKDEATIPPAGRDSDPEKAIKLEEFKKDLRQAHTVSTFTNPDELAASVTADLHRWLFDYYLTPRLERAARGEMARPQAQFLMDAIRDWDIFPPNLVQKLRGAGYVIASASSSVEVSGNVNESVITTGSGNIISTGGFNIKGDGNVFGSGNTVNVTKTTTTRQGATLNEFTALISQMRELLQFSKLDKDDRDTVETNLKTIEREAEKENPRLKLIESSLSSVKSLIESTESISSAAAKLMPMLSQAAEFARQLFP
jgi:uncharacterized protein DUF4062